MVVDGLNLNCWCLIFLLFLVSFLLLIIFVEMRCRLEPLGEVKARDW